MIIDDYMQLMFGVSKLSWPYIWSGSGKGPLHQIYVGDPLFQPRLSGNQRRRIKHELKSGRTVKHITSISPEDFPYWTTLDLGSMGEVMKEGE